MHLFAASMRMVVCMATHHCRCKYFPICVFFAPDSCTCVKQTLHSVCTRLDLIMYYNIHHRENFSLFLLWLECVIDEDRMSFAGHTEDMMLLVCRLFFHSIAIHRPNITRHRIMNVL